MSCPQGGIENTYISNIHCSYFQNHTSSNDVELKVLLPNKNILSLYIKRNSNTDNVYQVSSLVLNLVIFPLKKFLCTIWLQKLYSYSIK